MNPTSIHDKAIDSLEAGNPKRAIELCDRIISKYPNIPEPWFTKAYAQEELGLFRPALESYTRMLKLNPDSATGNYNQGLVRLILGEYREGFKQLEHRWKTSQMQPYSLQFPQPLWQGEDLSDKSILVFAEQGFGDTIMHCRFINKLKAKRVVFAVMPPLVSLFKGMYSTTTVTTSLYHPDCDYYVALMSLPYILGITIDTVPNEPYIQADPDKVRRWKESFSASRPKIGITWACEPHTPAPRLLMRSIPNTELAPLLELDAEFHSAQVWKPSEGVPDKIQWHADSLKDFSDTAALIAAMDLMVCLDGAVANLAGAMGANMILMSQHPPDWRWFTGGLEKTPWYPSAKIFRCKRKGAWSDVIKEVVEHLELNTNLRR